MTCLVQKLQMRISDGYTHLHLRFENWNCWLWLPDVSSSFVFIHQIRGFETQMEKWMAACDCIITKFCPLPVTLRVIWWLFILDYFRVCSVYLSFALTESEWRMFFWHLQAGPGIIVETQYKRTSYYPEWLHPWTGQCLCLLFQYSGILRRPLLFLEVSLSLIWFTEPKQRYSKAR
jgi:hypothetical protein